MMDHPHHHERPGDATMNHECIDPDLGQDLWRLDDPSTAPELRQALLRHCHHCSACASTRALADLLDRAVKSGVVDLAGPRRHGQRRAQWSLSLGGAALAASLALVLLLPPPAEQAPTRAALPPVRVIRPVTDEVIATPRPTISWTALERARAYEVTVTTEAGEERWRTRTEATEVRLPAGSDIDAHGRYRIWIEPVPSHLTPSGRFGSSFIRGDAWDAGRYRLKHAAGWVVALGGLGIALLAWGAVMVASDRRRGRRPLLRA